MNSAGILLASRLHPPQLPSAPDKSKDAVTTGGWRRRIKFGTRNRNSYTTAVL